MNKEREIVYSRKAKIDLEHQHVKPIKPKKCKKTHCEGVERENTSRFHS